MKSKVNIFWFRRDLRLEDNKGFCKALQGTYPVLPLFIFDTEILDNLNEDDARVSFIFDRVQQMCNQLKKQGSSIAMYYATPAKAFQEITSQYDVQNVITNRDYEPYARKRDEDISTALSEKGIGFYTFKDHVIFEKDEITKDDGAPYVVYTPYMKKWKHTFKSAKTFDNYNPTPYFKNLHQDTSIAYVTLANMGFLTSSIKVPDYDVSPKTIQQYEATRNYPAKDSTSKLGPHLRFGTVSIRQMVQKAIQQENEVFWQELIWREFFTQILWHFPHTVFNAFKPKYDRIDWRNNEIEFEKWATGTTGYVLVDAGMRELNATGYMHNRVRMLVASFLCKHLLIDWRWGEAYFAQKLLDYE
ncbi:MAG: DNA photolyase family protein, partial [Bacteroidetes bacterium]|nr:DNA photolyase family protein [Bacteroidota bacterium]